MNKSVRPFLFTISNIICLVNPPNGSWVLFTISRFVISKFECIIKIAAVLCSIHLPLTDGPSIKCCYIFNFFVFHQKLIKLDVMIYNNRKEIHKFRRLAGTFHLDSKVIFF